MVHIKEIEREIAHYFKGSSHNMDHTLRVYKLAEYIAKQEKANLNVVRYAALLHDIGRSVEDATQGRICHAKHSAKLAIGILYKKDISNDMIKRITHCIETHRFRNNKQPETLEAKVLFDADKLDSIGLVGVARAYMFGGEKGLRMYSPLNETQDINKNIYDSKEHTPVTEFVMKLSKVKDCLFTETGRRLAIKKHKVMVDFFNELEEEIKSINL